MQLDSKEDAERMQMEGDGLQKVDVDRLRSRIESIAATSKSAIFRQLMPVIEAKLAQGVRQAEILEALRGEGIDVSAATFKSYLNRFRSRDLAEGRDRGSYAAGEAAQAAPERASTTPAAGRLESPAAGLPAPVEGINNKGDLARARSVAIDMEKLAELGRTTRRNKQ